MASDLGVPPPNETIKTPRIARWNQDRKRQKRHKSKEESDSDREGKNPPAQKRADTGPARRPRRSGQDDDHIDFTA